VNCKNVPYLSLKICKRHLNSETLNLGDGVRHFCVFTKEDKGLLLTKIQILGPDHTDELDNDFAVQEVNKFILSVKNNTATGCDSIPPEAWKTSVTADKEAASLTILFNTVRDKR
jgi:hypothetical protein